MGRATKVLRTVAAMYEKKHNVSPVKKEQPSPKWEQPCKEATPLRRSSRQRRNIQVYSDETHLYSDDAERNEEEPTPERSTSTPQVDEEEYIPEHNHESDYEMYEDDDDGYSDDDSDEDYLDKNERRTNAKSRTKRTRAAPKSPANRDDPQAPRLGGSTTPQSLGSLAVRFVQHMRQAKNKTIILYKADAELNIKRRRMYDIINILEGVGLVQRLECRSEYQWIDPPADPNAKDESCSKQLGSLQQEVTDLRNEERKLDHWLARLQQQGSEHKATNQDRYCLRSADCQKLATDNGALMAVATTPGSILQLEEGGRKRKNGMHSFSILAAGIPSSHQTKSKKRRSNGVLANNQSSTMPMAFMMESASHPLRKLPLAWTKAEPDQEKPQIIPSPAPSSQAPKRQRCKRRVVSPEAVQAVSSKSDVMKPQPVVSLGVRCKKEEPPAHSDSLLDDDQSQVLPPSVGNQLFFSLKGLQPSSMTPASFPAPPPLVSWCSDISFSSMPPPPLFSSISSTFSSSALDALEPLDPSDLQPMFHRQTSLDMLASVACCP